MRGALTSAERTSDDLILGIRPEHFEDASLVDPQAISAGLVFERTPEVVESMGSDKYVYFRLEDGRAASTELDELAADAGVTDLSAATGQLVTRLSAESEVREGRPARVWVNLEKMHLFNPTDGRTITPDES